jgi:hypothetical protein
VPGLVQDLVAVVGRVVARWAFYRGRLGFALDHELQLVAGGVGAIALSSAVRAESRISRDPTVEGLP